MTSMFISYRRRDANETVGRLYDHLQRRLHRWQLFYDQKRLQPGSDFPDELRRQLSTAKVTLVIVGPCWVEILKDRQEEQGTDHVREEIRLALQSGNTVIPLLICNAAMPTVQDLKDFPELLPLLSKNARQLRPDPDFENDLEKLASFLDETILGVGPGLLLGGKYKLARQVGEGGMGVVYEAVDTSVKTSRARVAVKMILEGMNTKEVLARFRGEQEALVRMRHDHIAKVLDSGATPQGRPYFVMEFVDGEPITTYCDRKRLTPQQRLRLFQKVCSAVQHAHTKGIVHRDLKPSNVLVEEIDGRAVTKVIDFGLAKALTGKLTDRTLQTSYNRAVGTLLYMSPEQAAGRAQEIDTRTDVYSLGVLLYELLAGETPFTQDELNRIGDVAMCNAIIETDPPKPSTKLGSSHLRPSISANRQLDPAKLTRLLKNELEWIPLKAMAKQAGDRYETPNQFSEDIDAYLSHERTLAGKPTSVQQLRKYLIRNRGPVLAVSMIFLTLLAGLIATLWQKHRADTNATLAGQNAQRAELEKNRAEAGERLAKQNEATSENRRLEAEATLSRSNFLLANARWKQNRTAEAMELLRRIPKEHRNFEWYLDRRLYQGSYDTLYGHQASVSGVVFSPDGSLLVSCARDKTIKFWDAATGKEIRTLNGHEQGVSHVAFSPDGTQLASGSNEGTIKLWAVATGEEIRTLRGHQADVWSVDFSPDGLFLASSSADKTIKIWNASTGEEIRELRGHQRVVTSVVFSPDGQRLASGSQDGTVKLWDASTGTLVRTLHGHRSWVYRVCFNPDGSRLASASADLIGKTNHAIKLWDLSTGEEIHTLRGHIDGVLSLAFSPSGDTLASCSVDNTIRLWEVSTGDELRLLLGHQDMVNCVAFSNDGSRLASGSIDNTVKLWNVTSYQNRQRLALNNAETHEGVRILRGHQDMVNSVAFSSDGTLFASGSHDRLVKLWNAISGKEVRTFGHQSIVRSVVFSPDGSLLATGSHDSKIRLWDVAKGEEIGTPREQRSAVFSVAFCPEGKTLVFGLSNGTLVQWDVAAREEIRTLQGHVDIALSVAFSPDGSILASGSRDQTIKFWDAATGEEIRTLHGHLDSVQSIAFSPNGSVLASGSNDRTIKLWNVATGQEILTLRGHQEYITSIAFNSDGSRLASGSWDNTIRVWDTSTGEEIRTIRGHQAEVWSVAFSPDDSRLASGAKDGTICLWDGAQAEQYRVASGHQDMVTSVEFSPDASLFVSGSRDKTIKLWDAETVSEICTLLGHTEQVSSVSFSPDGSLFASGASDKTIKVWNTATGEEVRTLTGHLGEVQTVVFSRDGSKIYSQATILHPEYRVEKLSWDIRSGTSAELPSDVRAASRRYQSADEKWLLVPSGRNVLLIDREYRQLPFERNLRQFMARPKPNWHRLQSALADARGDLHAARFHQGWAIIADGVSALQDRRHQLGPDHPDTLASLVNLAVAYENIQKSDLAKPLFEEAFFRTAKLDPINSNTLTSIHNLASAYQVGGKFDRASQLYQEILDFEQLTLGKDHPNSLNSMAKLATAYVASGKLDLALPLYKNRYGLQRSKLGEDHPETLRCMITLAAAYQDTQRLNQALEVYKEALEILKRNLDPNLELDKLKQDLPIHAETLYLIINKFGNDHDYSLASKSILAGAYQATEQLDLAIPLYEDIFKLQRESQGPAHPDALASLVKLADAYFQARKWGLAMQRYEEAIQLLGSDHPSKVASMNNLAQIYESRGNSDLALKLYEDALELLTESLGPEQSDTLEVMVDLAYAYENAGKWDLAMPLYQEAIKLLNPDHPDKLLSMNSLARYYQAAGKFDLSLPLYHEVLEFLKTQFGPDNYWTVLGMGNLAEAYQEADKLEPALKLYEDMLEIQNDTLEPTDSDRLLTLYKFAKALVDAGRAADALPRFEEYLKVQRTELGPNTSAFAGELAIVSLHLLRGQQYKAAESWLRECLVIRRQTEPDSWKTFNTESSLGGALLGQEKFKEAEPLLLNGYEGMKAREAAIPSEAVDRITEASYRIIELYTATNNPDKANQFRSLHAEDAPPKPVTGEVEDAIR